MTEPQVSEGDPPHRPTDEPLSEEGAPSTHGTGGIPPLVSSTPPPLGTPPPLTARVSSLPPPPPGSTPAAAGLPRASSLPPPPPPPRAPRASEPPLSQAPPGKPFGGVYTLGERLDWGAGGVRYVQATKRGKGVALMVLPKAAAKHDTATSVQLLADHLEAIDEPTILRVRGSGLASGRVYVEHQLVDGQRLTELLGEPLTSLTLLRIADQVLRALIALHQAGMVHGHLSPDNILVLEGERPDKPIVRLLGAGVTPVLEEAGVWTRNPTPRGSFGAEYQPPEVGAGERQTKRSDFYAAGVLLHHMCVGAPFTEGTNYEDGFDDIPQLPDVIRRATSRDPAERYSDAAAMLAALDWLEVLSSKMNPHTQDIPLWMEHSIVGSIPVTKLNAQSGEFSVPAGTMVGSGEIPLPPSGDPGPISVPISVHPSPLPLVPAGNHSIPSIPMAAAVPRGARRGSDDQSLWWLAAALTLVIILMGLGLALMSKRQPQPQLQQPAAAPAAIPAAPAPTP